PDNLPYRPGRSPVSQSTEDAAHGAFMEAAWHRHLRVATLLTGDRHRAEELLQDCVVKLYIRWRRVSATDPHAYLRRMYSPGPTPRSPTRTGSPAGRSSSSPTTAHRCMSSGPRTRQCPAPGALICRPRRLPRADARR